ncbi:hypothetical protein [Kitasatospora fiedleri]|uniref:hypothetical protein n=1 Tax=Kitasatospora fiedleri TaxID=2991545 RepID=UPI00249B7CC4|nr:hypothetical protein [Kitasatospora fiedleri]
MTALAALRPGYNGTALAAALAAGAPAWSHLLTSVATIGDGTGPLGATAIGLLAAAIADRAVCWYDRDGQRHDLWLPRVALLSIATAPLYNHHTTTLLINFLTGGTP